MVDQIKYALFEQLDKLFPTLKTTYPNQTAEYRISEHAILTTEPFPKTKYLRIDKSMYTSDVADYYCRAYGKPDNDRDFFKALFFTSMLDIIKPILSFIFRLPKEGEIFSTLYNRDEDTVYGFSVNPKYRTARLLYKTKQKEEYFVNNWPNHIIPCSEKELLGYIERLTT